MLKRLPISAVLVVACLQFQWTWLRFVTSEASLRFALLRGYTVERLSPDVIAWGGHRFVFNTDCTFADVICGALPLLWIRHAGLARNGLVLLVVATGLYVFNLLRNLLVDTLFSAGLPWSITDQSIGALAYFLVWVFLVRWVERTSAMTSSTAATPSVVSP